MPYPDEVTVVQLATPGDARFGRLRGTFSDEVIDGSDVDLNPDFNAAAGTITFTPEMTAGSIAYASNPELAVYPKPITVTLDSNGSFDKKFAATDVGNPSGWTYRVSFALAGWNIPSFSISMPTNSDRFLPSLMPVASASGTLTLRGDKGDKGDPGNDGAGVSGTWTCSDTEPIGPELNDVWVDISEPGNIVLRVYLFAGGTFGWVPNPNA